MARTLLPHGVIVAEYLLDAAALYGGLLLSQAPSEPRCVDACWGFNLFLLGLLISGEMALSVGLLVGLVVLTIRMRRARLAHQPLQSRAATVGVASRAAVVGLVWGLVALPVLWCGGLLLLWLRDS
jgi:hypothetical protein